MFIRTFHICCPIYMKLTMRNINISFWRDFEFLEIRLWEGRSVLMGINIVTLRPTSKTKQDFESEDLYTTSRRKSLTILLLLHLFPKEIF